jgi:hypothetical protein
VFLFIVNFFYTLPELDCNFVLLAPPLWSGRTVESIFGAGVIAICEPIPLPRWKEPVVSRLSMHVVFLYRSILRKP